MGNQIWEMLKSLVTELVTSPLNLLLLAVCFFLIYKIFKLKRPSNETTEELSSVPLLPKMKKRDFTVEQLATYNGESNEDKRILVAVNQKVFDVTNNGRNMYGKGRVYETRPQNKIFEYLAKHKMLVIRNLNGNQAVSFNLVGLFSACLLSIFLQ